MNVQQKRGGVSSTSTISPPSPSPNAVRDQVHEPAHMESDMDHEATHEAVHDRPRVRTRTGRMRRSNMDDPFWLPLEEIPEGLDYQWKRFSVHGEEDPFYVAQMRDQGFEPVDPKVHPNWVPPGYKLPHIVKLGQMLMERPLELTRQAEAENRLMARTQMTDAEARLGRLPKESETGDPKIDSIMRDGRSQIQPKVVKEYMRPIRIEE